MVGMVIGLHITVHFPIVNTLHGDALHAPLQLSGVKVLRVVPNILCPLLDSLFHVSNLPGH